MVVGVVAHRPDSHVEGDSREGERRVDGASDRRQRSEAVLLPPANGSRRLLRERREGEDARPAMSQPK